jgi:hypothetical protein
MIPRDRPEPIEIEITPAMIEAALRAWREECGDLFPEGMLGIEDAVKAIFSVMLAASVRPKP